MRTSFHASLELANHPISAYEFEHAKDEHIFRRNVELAQLYIIGQRPMLYFDNLAIEDQSILHFEIKSRSYEKTLKGEINLIQQHLIESDEPTFQLGLGSHELRFDEENKHQVKLEINGFTIDEEIDGDLISKGGFSPDKIIYCYYKQYLDIKLQGNISEFLKFHVLYIGKATEQKVYERLSRHSTLQSLLSTIRPIDQGSLPAHELFILPIKLGENAKITQFGLPDSADQIVKHFENPSLPGNKAVALDAEKAFISSLKPSNNKIMFLKYPKSVDGLFNDNFDAYSYSIQEPITLIYEKGDIVGDLNFMMGDGILVVENKDVIVLNKSSKKGNYLGH